eukprot:10271090-Prorocentrum_lima.AAC.1
MGKADRDHGNTCESMKTTLETVIDEVGQLEQNITHNVEKDSENTVADVSASTECERKDLASLEL